MDDKENADAALCILGSLALSPGHRETAFAVCEAEWIRDPQLRGIFANLKRLHDSGRAFDRENILRFVGERDRDIAMDVLRAGRNLARGDSRFVEFCSTLLRDAYFMQAARVASGVNLVRGNEVEPKAIEWIWEGWLARRKFHVLGGQPGTGKTTLALAVAATVTTGGYFPDGSRAPMGTVAIWSGEDDLADSLVPRFKANGGDARRLVSVSGAYDEDGACIPFDPSLHLPKLAAQLAEIGDLALVIVDPVVSAVAGDSHRNTEVRRALQPLVDMAAESGAAVLGITHYTKGTSGRDPIDRVTGSLAFAAAPRIVWGTAKPTEEGRTRRLVRIKSNIGPDGGGFEYELEQAPIEAGHKIRNQRVFWGSAIEGAARELLGEVEAMDGGVSALDQAMQFLSALLEDGPVPVSKIDSLAENEGYSRNTLRRAKAKLQIEAEKGGMDSGWLWSLPKAPKVA